MRSAASRFVEAVSLHSDASFLRMMAAGGLFFDFGPIPGETGSGAESDSRMVVLDACDAGARSRDSGRRADGVGGPWDASPVVPGLGGRRRGARTPSPEGAATHCLHTRGVVAMLRRLDAVDAAARESTRLAREPRQFRDGVVPAQAKTTRRWRWLLIGEGLWRTRRRRKRPRSRAWGGVTCFRVPVDYIGRAL